MIDMIFRDDEELAGIHRSQCHESRDPIVFIDDTGFRYTVNNVAEDAGPI